MSPQYRWTYSMFRDITLSKLTANELPVPTYISYISDGEQQIKQGDLEISYTNITKVQVIFLLQMYARGHEMANLIMNKRTKATIFVL